MPSSKPMPWYFLFFLAIFASFLRKRRCPRRHLSWAYAGRRFLPGRLCDTIRYFHALAASSDRIKMFTVGKSTHGQDIEVAVISSPANLAKLDEYKKNAGRLARAEDLNDDQARELARSSKVIVHIDGGLHSDEVAGTQHTMILAYNLLTAKNDPQIDAILDNVILVLWPTLNPDGQDMVVHWYRQNLGSKYEVSAAAVALPGVCGAR
jgi:hypothetical protein